MQNETEAIPFKPKASLPQPLECPSFNRYEITMNIDKILARELGKLGAVGGAIGGAMGGGILTGVAGAIGGASGARSAARYLPTELCTREYLLPCDATKALTVIINALARLGQLQERSELESPNPTIAAVVSSGFMNLNPCVLTIEIDSHTETRTTVIIRGAAKEGLIKQYTAEKSVNRAIAAIEAASRP